MTALRTLAACVAAVWPSLVLAVELPQLRIMAPQPKERYGGDSNLTVFGEVDIPISATLEARVYHLLDDGDLIHMGGASFSLPLKGRFAVTLLPSSPGWRPGRARIEVHIANLKQVRAAVDFEIVAAPAAPGGDWVLRPPRSSGVVIDRDRGNRQSRTIPPGQRFLVRGTFPLRRKPGAIQGPPLVGEIQTTAEGKRPVTVESQSTFSFPDGDERHWYEIELTAPSAPGTYRLELTPLLEQGAKDIDAEAIMLEVVEPES